MELTSKKACFSSEVLGTECALPAEWITKSNFSEKTGTFRSKQIEYCLEFLDKVTNKLFSDIVFEI
jgi:hypothetical protein